MKKSLGMLLIVILVIVLFSYSVGYSQVPAEKAAAASSDVIQMVFSAGNSGPNPPFVTVLSASIKPPGGKDLFITFSAQTLVKALSVNDSFFRAPATLTLEDVAIQVRCLVDGVPVPIAPPSTLANVTLDNMIRTTKQTAFSRIVRGASLDFLTLVTAEGGARSFTWIKHDVGVGLHTVDIQVRFLFNNVDFPFFATFSDIAAVVGPRTLTVEEVMLRP